MRRVIYVAVVFLLCFAVMANPIQVLAEDMEHEHDENCSNEESSPNEHIHDGL